MKIIKLSQSEVTEVTETSQSGFETGALQASGLITPEQIQALEGEFLNNFTQKYNSLMTTLDSSVGELRTMSSNLVSDTNFADTNKTTEAYIGDGGALTEMFEKMTDIQNKFNELVDFISNEDMPIERSMQIREEARAIGVAV